MPWCKEARGLWVEGMVLDWRNIWLNLWFEEYIEIYQRACSRGLLLLPCLNNNNNNTVLLLGAQSDIQKLFQIVWKDACCFLILVLHCDLFLLEKAFPLSKYTAQRSPLLYNSGSKPRTSVPSKSSEQELLISRVRAYADLMRASNAYSLSFTSWTRTVKPEISLIAIGSLWKAPK